MKTSLIIGALIIVGLFIMFGVQPHTTEQTAIDVTVVDFNSCVLAGNPVMESYPRQCKDSSGNTFTEFIGNELEKSELIRITYPRPNDTITSPTTITGTARGYWFFEASFPIVVTDWDGVIIGEGYATADTDWMTEDFVPFTATVTFTMPSDTPYKRGTLILKKDNPSGEPKNDDALEVPVLF